ncbi:hypothetical protein [Jeotgalibacillus proteolyticus]|uniref:T4 recombination endonuclease VII dimerisation domain-containing protein n=1 Tax=Jeotgalibacillus proteolyticus TaxID=2082395 RepID=A0A2S5GAK7_9BACL|nr:hypothetical protein [Jeotgalibacillus proteolyticus]PPA70039.1 hypothetical protein C4B60_10615 [Jeotgalibacillus proteolyticus]
MINIVGPKGQRMRVTERAYNELYKDKGYKSVSDKPTVKEVQQAEVEAEEAADYSAQTEAALKRVKNEKLSAFLDEKGVEYQEDATKKDLIALIKG